MSAPRPIHVLAFAGSLREGSYNRALLRAAQELAPDGMTIDIFDLLGVPLYNADVEAQGDPERVAALKEAIRAADADEALCTDARDARPVAHALLRGGEVPLVVVDCRRGRGALPLPRPPLPAAG